MLPLPFNLLFERIQNKAIDPLPDVRRKPDRPELAVFIPIT